MSLQLSIFIVVVILIVGWFAIGTQLNVRRGEAALRWLQEGLPLVGEKTRLRWLGSSAVELKIQNAKPPFREAEVLVLLEPRDVPLMWWYTRLRGRRDLLIFRGTLRNLPHSELEALDAGSWSTRSISRRVRADNWTRLTVTGPLLAYSPHPSASASDIIAAANLDGVPLVRLSLRRREPNLEVQWKLEDIRKRSSRDLVHTLRRITEQV